MLVKKGVMFSGNIVIVQRRKASGSISFIGKMAAWLLLKLFINAN